MAAIGRYGPQPGLALIPVGDRRRGLTHVARAIAVSHKHLSSALHGHCPPSGEVRDRLPAYLGVALDQIFTPCALLATLRPGAHAWKYGRQDGAR